MKVSNVLPSPLLLMLLSVVRGYVPSVPYTKVKIDITQPTQISQPRSSITDEDTIKETIHNMLKGSRFVYTYATLRGIVNEHDVIEGNPKNKEKGVKFDTPALIVTQSGSQPESQNRLFKYPITAAAIDKFLRLNRNLLKQGPNGGDVSFDDRSDTTTSDSLPEMPLEKLMKEMGQYDGELWDYDDFHTEKAGLVYGVTLNKTKKRITVLFRGTVGAKDIMTDARFIPSTPEIFKNPTAGKGIKIHRGFASYLFKRNEGTCRKNQSTTHTKFDRIVASLKEIIDSLPENDRDDYDIYVTGHSLGGALANLFAFAVAETQSYSGGSYKNFNKVTLLTFAAPVVGNRAYNKAFQALERDGRLRHLRISNEGDVVPTSPVPGYIQNGVNMHLYRNKQMTLDYRNQKNLLTQLRLKSLANHMLPEYEARLHSSVNSDILNRTIEDIYTTAEDFTK